MISNSEIKKINSQG